VGWKALLVIVGPKVMVVMLDIVHIQKAGERVLDSRSAMPHDRQHNGSESIPL